MSSAYIPKAVRSQVFGHAGNSCEYCLAPGNVVLGSLHIDHIISLKQGGPSEFWNLAAACGRCNSLKGSDISAYIAKSEQIVDLYNPRKDDWKDHFHLEDSGVLVPKSLTGEGTTRLLRLNSPPRVLTRSMLIAEGINIVPKNK